MIALKATLMNTGRTRNQALLLTVLFMGLSDRQIVGIVKDAVYETLRQVPPPTVYVPYLQSRGDAVTLEIFAAGSLVQVASAIHAEIQPKLAGKPMQIRTLTATLERSLAQERLMATLATAFGLLALVLACVAWLVTWWLEDSKWGYWWRAVKDNPDAAESLGVVVFNSKMGAAAVSAFLTAVGGSFYAQFVSYIDPESVMGFQFSLLMALPAVLGGIGTLWGPVLGAVILIPLTELTRSFIGGSGRGVDLIVYGALIVLISLARPEGLVGLFSRRRKEAAR